MSLATFKKKSRHYPRVAPISGRGKNGFSLCGGHRNIGGVGRFRMVSNVTRTPFRGIDPMGNGGCCGTYFKFDTPSGGLNSGSPITNIPQIIKKSSKTTEGMLRTHFKWIYGGQYPNYWVQESDGNTTVSTRDQSTYINNLTQKTGGCVWKNPQNNGNCGTVFGYDEKDYLKNCNRGNKGACSYYIGTRKFIRMPYAKNFNTTTVSQSQYINNGGLYKKECLPTPSNKQPFPMKIVHNNDAEGCNVNYLTWQEAKAAGALPPDWIPYQGYVES